MAVYWDESLLFVPEFASLLPFWRMDLRFMRTEVSMIDLSKLVAVGSVAWVCTNEHAKQDSKEDIVVSRVFVILG